MPGLSRLFILFAPP
jgi:hypothetical protein